MSDYRPNWVFYRPKPYLVRLLKSKVPTWFVASIGAVVAAAVVMVLMLKR
jgi:hypothetical protein